jgi:hypothetical protein
MGIILVKEIQREEGIEKERRRYREGSKNRPKRNRPKSGRHPDIPEEKVQQEIKKMS